MTPKAKTPRSRSGKAKAAKIKESATELNEHDRAVAKYIAMVVRNAMEDFHVAHLSDEQMRELNPIVRNAIYTALHALRRVDSDPASRSYVEFALLLIPKYWEEPELLPDYVRAPR